MSTRLRLQRYGHKQQPYYRVIVTNRGAGSTAGYIEALGNFRPGSPADEEELELDEERIIHWLENGAQPSDTVKDLLSRAGILEKMAG